MPHDQFGRELKVGDLVIIPARVSAIQPYENFCNVSVTTLYGRKLNGSFETVNAINTAVLLKHSEPAKPEGHKASFEDVVSAVDGERMYQDRGLGNAERHEGMPRMTPGELILCMERYLHQAREEWNKPGGGVRCLDDVRKVTALGFQCMQLYGAPRREGF